MLVFISYHTPDHDKAQALGAALALRRPGTEWYFAPRNITGGAWWVPGLAGAVAHSDAVLFLAGRHIGPWQQLEYYEALRLSREKAGRPRLIPVVIADQAPGLPFFNLLHQIFAADPAARETLDAIERALDDSLPPDASPAWQRFQPYKGLPALEEADAAFFFGRDEETAAILDLIARHPDRIIALIGPSGVGKSSLARAGVLARLKSQLWPLETGEWPAGLRDSRAFLPLVIRPGEQPLKELALAFAQLYCTRSFELDEEAAGWARRFAEGSGLRDILRATRDKLAAALGAEPPKRFVVYLDQGEELYTRAGADEARRFSALVAEAAGHEAFSVLLSLRSDYYAAYQNDRDIFDASEHVDVLPLARDVLGEIVRKPALSLGARFESNDMAERVADATEREPGALPLLSDLLHEMWLHMQARGDGVLRWSDNPEIVDVAAPLRRRAEAFLADPTTDGAVLRRLFTLCLAHVPEVGEPVRRRAHRGECDAAEWAAAEKLASQDWRLLTLASAADGEPVVEVAHEQLLRRWPRLKTWLDEERDFLVWKGQVEHAAAAHGALPAAERDGALLMGRPLVVARGWFERRAADLAPETRNFVAASLAADTARRDAEQRRQRKVQIGTTIGLVVALILAGLAGWQWRSAVMERGVAEAQTKEAQSQRDRAEKTLAVLATTESGLVQDLVNKYLYSAIGYGGPVNEAQVPLLRDILTLVLKTATLLAKSGETSPALRLDQGAALNTTADLMVRLGNSSAALEAARQSRDIFEALAAADPDNTRYRQMLAVSYQKMGNALLAQKHPDEALSAYRHDEEIMERLARINRDNTIWQLALGISYEMIGNALLAQKHPDQALSAYRREEEIIEELTRTNSANTTWQRNLVDSFQKIGDALMAENHPDQALTAYRRDEELIEGLTRINRDNMDWQRGLGNSYEKMGDALHAQSDLAGALAAYRDSLAIRKALAEKDPGNIGWQGLVIVSDNRIGDVLAAQGDLVAALAAYRDGLAITKTLAQKHPGNTGWQTDLVLSLYKVANAGGEKEANLTEALAVLHRLDAAGVLPPDKKGWIATIEKELK